MTMIATDAEFSAAVLAAKPGDVLTLAPVTFSTLRARRIRQAGTVTIRAAERRRTVVNFGDFNNWGGYRFEGLEFRGGINGELFLSAGANDLDFADCNFTGGDSWDAWGYEGQVSKVMRARNITVRDSDIGRLRQAFFLQSSGGVTLEGNRLSHLREGVQIEGCKVVRIRRNEFSEFHPRYDLGEHPDCIQFFTRNVAVGSEDVEIAANRFFLGGRRPVQCMLIQSENFQNGRAPGAFHRDVRVLGNLIYSSHRNAIRVWSVRDAQVRGNVVLASHHVGSGWPRGRDGGRTAEPLNPCIRMDPNVTGVCEDNIAPFFETFAGVTARNNRTGWPVAA